MPEGHSRNRAQPQGAHIFLPRLVGAQIDSPILQVTDGASRRRQVIGADQGVTQILHYPFQVALCTRAIFHIECPENIGGHSFDLGKIVVTGSHLCA